MSRIPTHTLASAPVATRPVLETLVARSPTPGVPINLHAQMAHAPSVLIGYMAMRKALDDYGSFDPQTRTAILLTVAAADRCAYTVALNMLIARQAGWNEDETLAIRNGHVQDGKLAALLDVARQSAQTRATSTNQRGRRRSTQIGRTRSSPRLSRSLDWRSTSTHSSTTPAPTSIRARTDIDPPFAHMSGDGAASIDQDMSLTVLLIVEDQDRTRAFYEQVLGASVVRERDPVILQFHNIWIVANVGGPPTNDKPDVSLAPPLEPNLASYALNVRVSDAYAVYEQWRSRGAHFLTPPIQRDGEIRCYLRDPDGHLIEVGQSLRS